MVEETWRKALHAKGREWVQAELRRRPGRPDDTLYDVVFEEPQPTRQFCLNWCAEQDNRLFHFSASTIAAIAVFLLFIVCTFKAFQASNEPVALPPQAPAAAAAHRLPAAPPSNSSANSQPPTSQSSDSTTDAAPATPGLCAYINYDTDRCRVQGLGQYPLQNQHP